MRPNAYTPEEDQILLDTTGEGPDETNRRLTAAGFQERTPGAIKQRRHFLRTTQQAAGMGEIDSLTKALARRRLLTEELEKLAAQRQAIEDEVRQLNAVIHGLLDELKEEIPPVEEVA